MSAWTAPNRLLMPARESTLSLTGASTVIVVITAAPAAVQASAYSAVQMSSTVYSPSATMVLATLSFGHHDGSKMYDATPSKSVVSPGVLTVDQLRPRARRPLRLDGVRLVDRHRLLTGDDPLDGSDLSVLAGDRRQGAGRRRRRPSALR